MLLSILGDVPCEELPVIVIDTLDECGGLRHDSSAKDNYKGLLCTFKHWVQVDHLKKFKLIITSRPEDAIAKMFPDSVSIHDILSGNNVKLEDSASNNICVFLKSKFNEIEMEPTWIAKAIDYLTPRAADIFIWATIVADFLKLDLMTHFTMLESEGNVKGLTSLYSLYFTVFKASFGRELEKEEINAVTSVMGAMIFSKELLYDDILIMLPEVKILDLKLDRLKFI